MSAAFFRLIRLITFHAAQNTAALDMSNRIIKSLDCRKIILIFCILEVDFAISVITLLVAFNESFQKASVDKSVCIIDIVHLIVLSAIKNPLLDVYFNWITALLAVRFLSVMGAYLTPSALFAVSFLPVMGAYLSPSAIFALIFLPVMRTYFRPSAIFAGLLLPVMRAYLTPSAFSAVRFSTTPRKILAVDTQFKQLRKRSLKKIQASAGFEPVTSAIPVQCSTN